MKIIVVGCESSGTRWLYHNVVVHPDVSQVTHWSIPWRDENPTWRIINQLPENDAILFMCRDGSCTSSSMLQGAGWHQLLKNHHQNPADQRYELHSEDPIENWSKSAEIIADQARILRKNIQFVSYESLVQLRKPVLFGLFSNLGLNPKSYEYYDKDHNNLTQFIPWTGGGSLFANDGNKKYFKG